ncbi:MAG TPA: DNA primase [Acidimicrobiales bacterium]|jgi:DNA primase|nr:DNA primase [Acidimicrobiales bacterium]
MGIPDEDVAQVRAATDIVALIGEHAALKKVGRRWTGLCPFHTEKSASFSVNAEEGFYYCFGCQASGDAITFVRAMEHLDFVDAVRLLADRAGVVLHEDAEVGKDRKRRTDLLDAMERAVVWYHERLLRSPDAGPARDYLRSRGYDGEVVRQFRLGWAPDEWDALSRALKLSERTLTDSGLGFINKRGRSQDAFRNRVLFPICDPSGRPVALGGRILPLRAGQPPSERPEPKYKNSQETPIYAKRRTLYALNWAKQDVIAKGEVVVCEGYTDVIGFFQAGVPRAVATCGTALGEEHFTLLRNFGRRIVLAYDADSAGQSATSRVYEWERKHEVDVVVAELPGGSDPGELARTDPDSLARAVAEARPFLQFRIDRILGAGDLGTAEGRARMADAALTAVAEHPDDLVRDQYVMQLSDRCRLEAPRLRERLEHLRAHPPAEPPPKRARPTSPNDASGDPGDRRDPEDEHEWDDSFGAAPIVVQRAGPGMEALKLAVHRPEDVADRLQPVLFVDVTQRDAFTALVEHDDLHDAIASGSPAVAGLLRRITVEEPLIGDPEIGDPVDSVVAVLLREAVRRALSGVEKESRGLDASWQAGAAQTAQVRHWLDELDDPASRRTAADRLVAWLTERERVEG